MNLEKLVRQNILGLKPYTSARESHLDGILLDANENSLGSVVTFEGLELNRYPDPNQRALRKAVSEIINVPQENLFFGVGSDEIIELLIKIFCHPRKDEVIICEPTYGMYRVCCDTNDVAVKNIPLDSKYDIDLDEVKKAVTEKTKLIFLCSPNNPSSNLLSKDKIIELATTEDVIVVVDEAYIDFTKTTGLAEEAYQIPNVVVMRTFSKAWGMAGVRCGYCISSTVITNLLFKVKAPYSINKLTSDFILKAIAKKENYLRFVDKILSERDRVTVELKNLKKVKKVLPSDSNFISFAVDEPQKVFLCLERKRIIIRDRSNQFNFSGYLRVTIGTEEENNKFIVELKKILT